MKKSFWTTLHSPSRWFLATTCLFLAVLLTPVQAETPPDPAPGTYQLPIPPHSAVYEVLRRGSKIGELTVTLEGNDIAGYRYTTTTKATSRMARLLRASADETAQFRYADGAILPLHYEQSTSLPGRSRFWEVNFDWTEPAARGEDHNGALDVPLTRGTLDPLTLRLALALAIDRDGLAAERYEFEVLERNEVETQAFSNTGYVHITLPAGCLEAWQLERVREDSSRTLTSWHAPDFHFMPIRILQVRDGREDLDIRLMESDLLDPPEECG